MQPPTGSRYFYRCVSLATLPCNPVSLATCPLGSPSNQGRDTKVTKRRRQDVAAAAYTDVFKAVWNLSIPSLVVGPPAGHSTNNTQVCVPRNPVSLATCPHGSPSNQGRDTEVTKRRRQDVAAAAYTDVFKAGWNLSIPSLVVNPPARHSKNSLHVCVPCNHWSLVLRPAIPRITRRCVSPATRGSIQSGLEP